MQETTAKKPFIVQTESTFMPWSPTLRSRLLDQALREKLAPSRQTAPPPISQLVHEAIAAMLQPAPADRAALVEACTCLYQRQREIYLSTIIPDALRKRQYITGHGLILSPNNSLTSLLDVLRIQAFTRGIDRALKQLTETFNQTKPLHIVYPACGPCAPLLLPLISYYHAQALYTPNDLQITLIDIQPGAVMSLKALINELGISAYIRDIVCEDAINYHQSAPIHLVILEAMQHGFSREAHLPLAHKFSTLLAPQGIMLPQEIRVSAFLNSGQQEFVDAWQDMRHCQAMEISAAALTCRTPLSDIFTITAASLAGLKIKTLDADTALIECGRITIPHNLLKSERQMLMLSARIRVFGNEWLNEYDSGITHPLPDEQICIDFTPAQMQPGDILIKGGDCLQFYYRLNGLPGFFAVPVNT